MVLDWITILAWGEILRILQVLDTTQSTILLRITLNDASYIVSFAAILIFYSLFPQPCYPSRIELMHEAQRLEKT
jgi:hypothetical protein